MVDQQALPWEVYVPRQPSHVVSFPSNASLCFEICVMQRLCKTEDFHDRRCQRYQPRWIRNRLADSLADPSRCVRWTVVYQICYLSTFFCRSRNGHAPIFYGSVLSSKSRLLLHARRTKQIIRKAGGQSSSAPLHQTGAIIPTHQSTTGRRFREGCDFQSSTSCILYTYWEY